MDHSLVERDFAPEAVAAGAARRFAVSASRVSGELAATVQLLVSELASNAILHARTPFTVRVERRSDLLRVEVVDLSPLQPARKEYGPEAVTGRGLRIVEGFADRWGIEDRRPGKAVWFEFDAPPPEPAPSTDGALVEVVLIGFPVDVYQRASAHQEALQREFDVLQAAPGDRHDVPERLRALLDELNLRYEAASAQGLADVHAAIDAGVSVTDVCYHVPADAAAAADRLGAMLDEADEFCRKGEQLITVATPPESLAFRRWFLGEFRRQVDGHAPVAWSDYLLANPILEPVPDGDGPMPATLFPRLDLPPDWRVAGSAEEPVLEVSGSLDLHTAGLLRDALQELRGAGARRLTVDLREVGFMDSVGLSIVVAAHVRLGDEGAVLQLVVPQRLRRLLEVAALDDVLDLRDG